MLGAEPLEPGPGEQAGDRLLGRGRGGCPGVAHHGQGGGVAGPRGGQLATQAVHLVDQDPAEISLQVLDTRQVVDLGDRGDGGQESVPGQVRISGTARGEPSYLWVLPDRQQFGRELAAGRRRRPRSFPIAAWFSRSQNSPWKRPVRVGQGPHPFLGPNAAELISLLRELPFKSETVS